MNTSMNAIGIALMWCVVQVTLLGVLAAGLYLLVRRLRPAAAASVVLCSMTMVVVLSLLALSPWPRWIEPSAARSSREPVAAVARNSLPAAAEGGAAAETIRVDHSRLPSASEEATARPSGPPAVAVVWQAFLSEMAQPKIADQRSTWRWPAMAATVLLAAMAGGLGWLVLGMIAVRWQRVASRPVRDAGLLELIETLRAELGCRRPVELRQADDLATAATIGWRKPVLLLPADWTTWTADQRRAVLAHEIAHARSQDFLALLFGQLGLVLHFYHPLLHWLMNRLRLEQELAADAAAASVSGGQRQYLTTIAELALHQQGQPLLWPARAFLPTQTTFLRRIAMLRDSKLRLGRLSLLGRASTIVAVLACGLLVAGLRGPGGASPALADEPKKPAATAAEQPAKPAAADNSIDTTFLTDAATAIVVIRPAVAFGRPEFAVLAKLLPANIAPSGTKLTDFRQITVMIPEKEIPSGPRDLVVMQWVKPVAEAYLMQRKPEGGYTIKETDGKKIYVEPRRGGHAYLLYDEHTLIDAGSEQAMVAYLEATRGVLPKWLPPKTWELLRDDHIVFAANTAALWAEEMTRNAKGARPPLPDPWLTMLPLWQDTNYVGAGARLDERVTAHAWLAAKDADSSAKVQRTIEAAKPLVQALLSNSNARTAIGAGQPPDPVLAMLVDAGGHLLDNLKSQPDGNVVQAETYAELDRARLASLAPRIAADQERAQASNSLKMLALGMHTYHDAKGHLPPAVLYGPDGKTPYSWRVALLPYLEQADLYKQYHFDEPWDGPNNRILLEKMPDVFRSPKAPRGSTNTSYFALVGPGTIFENTKGPRFAEIKDGMSHTIMLVEAKQDIPWTKPEDIPYDPNKPLPELGGCFEDGFNVAMADGAVRFLPSTISEKILRALITEAGGEPVTIQDALRSATATGPGQVYESPHSAIPPNSEQAKAIAEIQRLGGDVTVARYDPKSPDTAVDTVDLRGTKVTDAGLESLKGLSHLQTLNLSNTQVTDAGLEHLSGVTTLQALNLAGDNVTGVGLQHLKGLTKLQWLNLDGAPVTDSGLEQLKGLKGLQWLGLCGTKVTDAGLEHLEGLTNLEYLNLLDAHVTDAGSEHLKRLTSLKRLFLRGTQITDDGLVHLKGLTNLNFLNLMDTKVTDSGLEALKGLNNLRELILKATKVTDAGLEHLQGLTKLQSLNLERTKVTDEGVEKLQQALPNCKISH